MGSAAEDLLRLGWARLPGAVTAEVVADLMAAPRPEWHPLPEEEGVVRQHGFGSYLPFFGGRALASMAARNLTSANAGNGVVVEKDDPRTPPTAKGQERQEAAQFCGASSPPWSPPSLKSTPHTPKHCFAGSSERWSAWRPTT